jgi:hypothetical protein
VSEARSLRYDAAFNAAEPPGENPGLFNGKSILVPKNLSTLRKKQVARARGTPAGEDDFDTIIR